MAASMIFIETEVNKCWQNLLPNNEPSGFLL